MILADSSTITGQSAVLPLLLATFTPTVSGEYFATVNLSLLAGTGVYRLVSTRQIGGVGAIYQSATAAVGVSAGITTLMISTIPTPLLAGDVLKIYVQGLAGDTAIDGVTEIFRSDTINEIQSGLALEATLTAIKGAGWSTETLAAIDVLIDAIKVKTDALDNSTVTFVTAVNGTTITILRGDTFSGSITDIGALTDYVSLDFTVKESYSKTDDEATIRIRKNASGVGDGLMRLNGAAPTSNALGSIAIDDLASGDITITLDETVTDDLSTGTYVYDIQLIKASSVKTLTYGKLIVTADVTRAVA